MKTLSKHFPRNFPETLFSSLLAISIILGLNPIIINALLDVFFHYFLNDLSSPLPFSINFYNLKRLDELSILVLTAGLLISSKRLKLDLFDAWSFLSKPIQIAIPLFFTLGLVSSIFAIHPESAFIELANDSLLLTLGLLISRQILHARFIFMTKMAFAIGIGIYVLLAIFAYLVTYYQFVRGVHYSIETLEYLTVYPQFLNPRFFAQVFILTWPLLIYLSAVMWKKRPALSLLILLISSYWITLGIENESRAIFLSVGIALAIVLFFLRKQIDHLSLWFKFFSANLLISLCLIYILFSIGLNFDNPFLALFDRSGQAANYMDRINLWTYTFHEFVLHHPLLGVGPLNFAAFANPIGVAHPHNVILKIAAEWGIPAALIFCFVLAKGLFAWFSFLKKQISSPHPYMPKLLIQMSLALILISSLIDSMISGNTVMPLSQLFLAILWGWAYGLLTENKHAETRNTKLEKFHFKKEFLLTLGLLLAIAVIIIITIHNLIHLNQNTRLAVKVACEQNHHCVFPPLFWFPEQVSPIQDWT